jgi:hypothetical protein
MVLWGALVVLVAGAVGLVAAVGGGDDGAAPALPLSLTSGQGAGAGADDAQAASAATLEFAPRTTYVPADDLPSGGGTEPAYRLASSVDEGTVRDLAAALGVEGEPSEQDGTWHAGDGEMVLDIYEAGASWSAYRNVGSGTTGSGGAAVPPDAPVSDAPAADAPLAEGEECVQRGDVTECSIESSGSASSGVAAACPSDPAVLCPDPRTPGPTEPPQPPQRPADLPSEDEARRIALDLLAAAGTDVEGADVQVADGVVQWSVTVEPRLGGLPAPGLAAYVAVGAGGRIDSASGYVGPPEELGDYDLIGTRRAIERLNDGSWGYRTMDAAAEPGVMTETETNSATASPETTIPAGDEPRTLPAPADDPATTGTTGTVPPTTIVGGGASGGAGAVPPTTIVDGGASDGAGAGQIAPGEPAPGGPPTPEPAPVPVPEPVEVAVTDAEVVLVSVPSWDDTGTYLVPGYRFTAEDRSEPLVPAVTDDMLAPPPAGEGEERVPLPAPAEEPPTTGTVPPTTAEAQPAGAEVDIVLWHCGIEPVEVDGQRWVADPPPFDETNAPPELTRHGTVAVAPDGGSATYTDDSGITVDLVPVADDWAPPPCD